MAARAVTLKEALTGVDPAVQAHQVANLVLVSLQARGVMSGPQLRELMNSPQLETVNAPASAPLPIPDVQAPV